VVILSESEDLLIDRVLHYSNRCSFASSSRRSRSCSLLIQVLASATIRVASVEIAGFLCSV